MQCVPRRLLPRSSGSVMCVGKNVTARLGSEFSPSSCVFCRRNFGHLTDPGCVNKTAKASFRTRTSSLNRLSVAGSSLSLPLSNIDLYPSCRSISTSITSMRKKDYYREEKLPIYDYGAINPEKKRLYVFGQAAHGGLGLHQLLQPELEHQKRMLYMQRPVRHWFGDTHAIIDVAAGHGFTLLATKPKLQSGPVIFGCGYNTKSQLGYQPNKWGKPLGCLIAFVPLPLPLDKSSKVLAIAAGRGHSLISVEGKGIIALGDNSSGQCGRNIIEDEEYSGSKYICRIPRFGSTHDDDVVKLVSRHDVSLCVTRIGSVYTFGCNHQGQLGRGKDVTSQWIAKPVEGDLKGEHVTKVATSGASVLAITENGQLFGWGLNDCGQVNPAEIAKIYYHPIHIKLPRGVGKIIDVAVGDMFSFVLNEFGNVYVWGNGNCLGLGPKSSFIKSPTLMPPPLFGRNEFNRDVSVVEIASSFKYAAAVNSLGDLFTWGENGSGCLGLGKLQSNYQFFPFKVALGVPVHKVSLGVDHTVLMTKAGY